MTWCLSSFKEEFSWNNGEWIRYGRRGSITGLLESLRVEMVARTRKESCSRFTIQDLQTTLGYAKLLFLGFQNTYSHIQCGIPVDYIVCFYFLTRL